MMNTRNILVLLSFISLLGLTANEASAQNRRSTAPRLNDADHYEVCWWDDRFRSTFCSMQEINEDTEFEDQEVETCSLNPRVGMLQCDTEIRSMPVRQRNDPRGATRKSPPSRGRN